jgi:GntR family transcriptional regulator
MKRGEPAYHRIRRDLLNKIESTEYKHGEYLPSEPKLCDFYNVSRTTVRMAVNSLVEDGYLTIVRGKGTKVTSTKLRCKISNVMSFTDVISQQGMRTGLQEVRINKIKPSKDICDKLDIDSYEDVYEIYRVRNADDEPISIHYSYIPCKYMPDYSIELFHEIKSLYKILEDKYNIFIHVSEDNISALKAGKEISKILNIDDNDPILFIERLAYDINNKIIEYNKTSIRGDRYSQMITMKKRMN